jgi:hypothetical protein
MILNALACGPGDQPSRFAGGAVCAVGMLRMPTSLKRDSIWLLAAAIFGLLVLPLLVYFTGTATLGPYSGGGPARFLVDFFRDLARLEWQALTLATVPLVLMFLWRLLRRLRRRIADAHRRDAAPSTRREPTL